MGDEVGAGSHRREEEQGGEERECEAHGFRS
jgi:hypothetical protein